MVEKKRIWIAWEKQQRSVNMSKIMGAEFMIIDYDRFGSFRHILCIMHTLLVLLRCRNKVVFVQNPSVFLALQACFLKKIIGYPLIVDRHSNFMLGQENKNEFRYKLFYIISNFTLKHANITIVTNTQIAERVSQAGGYSSILPDPIPELAKYQTVDIYSHLENFSILFPCSWSKDEPIQDVVDACNLFGGKVTVYITGRPKQNFTHSLSSIPSNFIKTGFLSDEEYFSLMAKCHIVMPLTKYPEILVCGGYEGVSLEKPLILSDTVTLREYFNKGTEYTNCTPKNIYDATTKIRQNYGMYKNEIIELKKELLCSWQIKFESLKQMLVP
jgi:glycosyltransferase involved in cell wall biosynthesis